MTSALTLALMTAINRPTEVTKTVVIIRVNRELAETACTPTNSSLRQIVIVVGIVIVTKSARINVVVIFHQRMLHGDARR